MRTITRTIHFVGALVLSGLAFFASGQASRAARLDVRAGAVSVSVNAQEQPSPRVAEPPRVAPPVVTAPADVATPARLPILVSDWTDDWFDADTYPSLKSAALNLGARWGREAARRLDSQVKTIEVHTKRNIPIAVAHEARTGIASMVHGTMVEVAGDECRKSASVHCVSLTLHDHDEHSRLGVRQAGLLQVESEAQVVQANFVEKRWAEDFSDFANARPKESWIIGRSKDPCMSDWEARDGALASAAAQLFPIVRDRIRSGGGGHWGRYDDERLRERIRYALSSDNNLVPDKFLQRATRPYGSVFRQAVLVDASRPNLDHLIMLSRQEVVEHRQSFARTLLSAGVLFFVVYLLYLFVNSMTRGYFVWSLRMVAVTVVVLGVIVLLLVG
jgi:hypothetical protein